MWTLEDIVMSNVLRRPGKIAICFGQVALRVCLVSLGSAAPPHTYAICHRW